MVAGPAAYRVALCAVDRGPRLSRGPRVSVERGTVALVEPYKPPSSHW